MFFILSKDKIVTYCISFFMIMLLLGIAFQTKNKEETRAASSNNIESNNQIHQMKK